jgi:hypothetical protein
LRLDLIRIHHAPYSDLTPLARWFIMLRALATVAICIWIS